MRVYTKLQTWQYGAHTQGKGTMKTCFGLQKLSILIIATKHELLNVYHCCSTVNQKLESSQWRVWKGEKCWKKDTERGLNYCLLSIFYCLKK